jgi:surface antigen
MALFGGMLGFVTGASSTPVAGTLSSAIIAGVLGIVAGRSGVADKGDQQRSRATQAAPRPTLQGFCRRCSLPMRSRR